jgi:mannose-6-phosphate isomerase-like protein (cupin superfamily)
MKYLVALQEAEVVQNGKNTTYRMLSDKHGCVNGCNTGMNLIKRDDYNGPGTHEDQEGLFVVAGSGWLKMGAEEIKLLPDMSVIIPAGIEHCMRKDPEADQLKIFWFHAAV